MKTIFLVFTLLLSGYSFGQAIQLKEQSNQLKPELWLGIWDKKNSASKINIDTLSYDDIPKYLDFRGTVVEALRWTDEASEKILVQTITGQFNRKDYEENSKEFLIQDKSELYVYLFERKESGDKFNISWKIHDFTECFGVDLFTGFIPKATTITDIDNDGITEVTVPYVLICRGGMDPGTMKIIMYEGSEKYALRGSTMIACDGENPYGGKNSASENLNSNAVFLNFLNKRWDSHKCEKDRFY